MKYIPLLGFCLLASIVLAAPVQNSDGTCSAYTVKGGDNCDSIARANGLQVSDLSTFNDKTTWGWYGCNPLMTGTAICLSTGSPPLPAPDANAVCGPTKPGSKRPTDGTKLQDMNPCLLNACCDIWGQCGTTPEFCTGDIGPTGNPGTAPKGKAGCISNCGVVIQNMQKAASPINVGYYEGFNFDRPCVNMRASEIDSSKYTHIHWAFADVSSGDFKLSVNDTYKQWGPFKALTGIKKIVSIGGWGFSTNYATYSILRDAMLSSNNKKFAQNIVDFLNANNLDGIDIDWEYPNAPDNQGEPALPPKGNPNDAINYFVLLYNLRQIMPSGKTISIALPASYWYLKAFPVTAMNTYVDYFVYMTYDLHGQWDSGNKWAMEACPGGNCLRSHVNVTETGWALAMLTKAGIPTSKIVVGISSYGRSFGLTDPGCTATMCTFKGDARTSYATPGECTRTGGYISNAEIEKIIAQGGSDIISWRDGVSDSDILVYGNGQWVAYMNEATRDRRKKNYGLYSFAGTADWAIDLQAYSINDNNPTGISEEPDYRSCDPSPRFADLNALSQSAGNYRTECIEQYTLETLITMTDTAYNNYTVVNKGYDDVYGYYPKYIKRIVPSIVNNIFMFAVPKNDDGNYLPPFGDGMNYFNCENLKSGKKGPCSTFKSGFDLTTVRLTLTDSDGYTKALAKLGVMTDWVKFADFTLERRYPRGEKTPGGRQNFPMQNYPVLNDSLVLINPKDVITKALGDVPALLNEMRITLMEVMLGQYVGGSVSDALDAYSTVTFTLMTAVENMAQAKALAVQEEKTEQKEATDRIKNIVLAVLTVVLMFVPFIGEELGTAVGVASLGRLAVLVSEAGNTGIAIYDTVQDPSSAFVNALGLLLGVGGLVRQERNALGFAKIANARSALDAVQAAKLGRIFQEQNSKLTSLKGVCRWN